MRIIEKEAEISTREIDPSRISCVGKLMGPCSQHLQHFQHFQRLQRSGVLPFVSRLAGAVSIVALVIACGGKDKKDKTTPDGAGSGNGSAVTGDPANMDPDGGFGDPTDPTVGDPSDPSDPSDPGTGPSDPSKPPEIKPPGLDLTPAQKAAKVREHVGKGKSALQGNAPNADTAITEAKYALAADETSVKAMVLLAQANIIKKYYDQALDVLNKAAKRGGDKDRQVHFLTGLVFDKTERPDDAIKSYERAVAIAPNYQSALMNLGVHYLANQRFREAASVYERLTGRLSYTTAAAWNNLGSAYRGQSAGAGLAPATRNSLILRAETTYKRSISSSKNYGPAYYNLGLLYLDSDPFPSGGGELDRLARLKRAKTYFDEYRGMPGADAKRVDDVAATAQKLIAKEERLRKKAEDRRKRDAARGND